MDVNTIMTTVASILILISAALYFTATVFGNGKKKSSSGNEGSNELLMELKKQNALIQSQMEKLEREIRVFSGKQENQAKTIIKYNKENARQLALSERDTLMRVMQELKKAIENNAGSVVVKEAPTAASVMEEVSDAELFEVSESPVEEEMVSVQEESIAEEPDLSSLFAGMAEEAVPAAEEPEVEDLFATEIPETSEMPEFSDELDLSSLFAEMEKEGVPVLTEEEPEQVSAPGSDPLAGFGSDPNAMMTPEDIARLLEAMGQ